MDYSHRYKQQGDNDTNVKLSSKGANKSRLVPKNTVLATCIGNSIGGKVLTKRTTGFNQQINALIPNQNSNPYFLYSRFSLFGRIISEFFAQGTMPIINKTAFSTIMFDVPTLPEQRKIGRYFNILDKLIHLQRNKLELLRKLKLGYTQRMFPRRNEIQLRIRFDGFRDNWEEVTLGDVAQFVNGKAFRQKDLLDKGKYPVIRVGNFYTDKKVYYSNQDLASKYYINDGDLLYTWLATFGPHIWHGNKSIYHYHIWKVVCWKIYKSFLL